MAQGAQLRRRITAANAMSFQQIGAEKGVLPQRHGIVKITQRIAHRFGKIAFAEEKFCRLLRRRRRMGNAHGDFTFRQQIEPGQRRRHPPVMAVDAITPTANGVIRRCQTMKIGVCKDPCPEIRLTTRDKGIGEARGGQVMLHHCQEDATLHWRHGLVTVGGQPEAEKGRTFACA